MRFTLVSLALPLLLPLTLAAESTPLITKEAVAQSLEAHAGEWEAAIQTHKPRLFFSDKTWPKVTEEIEAMQPPRAAYREAFFTKADHLLTTPLPVYLPPEEVAGKRGDAPNLHAAQEELWQRDVGNEIFGFAFAVRLRPENEAYRKRLHDLVMEAITYDTWGRSYPKMGSNADLSAGHISRGIALAYDWHSGIFSDEEQAQIRQVIAERMPCLLKGLYGDAYWARGYEENHNHVSVNGLAYCGIAFYDEIPQAPEWLAAARLDFINVGRFMSADGSSVEGVSYWTYGIAFILQFIEATRPIIDSKALYEQPFLQHAAAFRLMAATTDLGSNLPWGDSVKRDWSGPHHILYCLSDQYNDPDSSWLAENLPYPLRGGLDELALQMLWARKAPQPSQPPSQLDHRLTENEMVTTRSGWSANDYLLAIKAGYTNRNHSHLDAGSLALAFGDEWLLIAPGYGKPDGSGDYWQRNGPRWEFFSNATESHSTLLINGKNQSFDVDAKAVVTEFFSSPNWNWSTIDLTRAYNDISSAERSVLHRRGEYILVFDSVTAPKPVTTEWLAQFHQKPIEEPDGSLLVPGRKGRLRVQMLEPSMPFSPREPKSAKIDVKRDRYFSYAVEQEGTPLGFIALLQPRFMNTPLTPLQTVVAESKPDSSLLAISNGDWIDHIAYSKQPTAFSLDLNFSGTPEVNATAAITAAMAVVRTQHGVVESFLALQTTAIALPGFTYQAEEPCDMAGRRGADGGWIVQATRAIGESITLPQDLSIQIDVENFPTQERHAES